MKNIHDVQATSFKLKSSIFQELQNISKRFYKILYWRDWKDDKRGITPKSFGSCLHSVIKNISSLPEHATFLYKPFIRYGRQIDASVCDYRDKFIEHECISLSHAYVLTQGRVH